MFNSKLRSALLGWGAMVASSVVGGSQLQNCVFSIIPYLIKVIITNTSSSAGKKHGNVNRIVKGSFLWQMELE